MFVPLLTERLNKIDDDVQRLLDEKLAILRTLQVGYLHEIYLNTLHEHTGMHSHDICLIVTINCAYLI